MNANYNTRRLIDLIIKPIVTEKATLLMEQNKYVFDVQPKATKPEIKAAIESLFEVTVTKVNTARPRVGNAEWEGLLATSRYIREPLLLYKKAIKSRYSQMCKS